MFNDKLFRYKEFTIPFVAYRAGELSREDFLQLIDELKEICFEQHASVRDSLNKDADLRKNQPKAHENITRAMEMFEDALDEVEAALMGNEEDEKERLDISMETFKKGNLLLADGYYELDEVMERTDFKAEI